MTFIERAIAKLGVVGILTILLVASVLINLWQFNRLSKASARCDTRIAELQAATLAAADERDDESIDVADDADAEAADAVQTITIETVRYVDRIRQVPVEVPANCPRALPDGVRQALDDAAAAANRPL